MTKHADERIVRVAKALLWEWTTEGDEQERLSWIEAASDVIDLPDVETIARRLCKRNGNCDREIDLCPNLSDCTHWRSFEDYAKAVVAARNPT